MTSENNSSGILTFCDSKLNYNSMCNYLRTTAGGAGGERDRAAGRGGDTRSFIFGGCATGAHLNRGLSRIRRFAKVKRRT